MKRIVVYEDEKGVYDYSDWIKEHIGNRSLSEVIQQISMRVDLSKSSIRRYLLGDQNGGVEFAMVASDVLDTDTVEHVARYLASVYDVVEWRLFYGAAKAIVDRVNRKGESP